MSEVVVRVSYLPSYCRRNVSYDDGRYISFAASENISIAVIVV